MNERVKELRKRLRLNQDEFAAKLGVTAPAISKIESGARNITDQMIQMMVLVYGVNENWLRTGEEPMLCEAESSTINALCAEHRLGALEKHILETYCRLSDDKRKVIMEFIGSIQLPTAEPTRSQKAEAPRAPKKISVIGNAHPGHTMPTIEDLEEAGYQDAAFSTSKTLAELNEEEPDTDDTP